MSLPKGGATGLHPPPLGAWQNSPGYFPPSALPLDASGAPARGTEKPEGPSSRRPAGDEDRRSISSGRRPRSRSRRQRRGRRKRSDSRSRSSSQRSGGRRRSDSRKYHKRGRAVDDAPAPEEPARAGVAVSSTTGPRQPFPSKNKKPFPSKGEQQMPKVLPKDGAQASVTPLNVAPPGPPGPPISEAGQQVPQNDTPGLSISAIADAYRLPPEVTALLLQQQGQLQQKQQQEQPRAVLAPELQQEQRQLPQALPSQMLPPPNLAEMQPQPQQQPQLQPHLQPCHMQVLPSQTSNTVSHPTSSNDSCSQQGPNPSTHAVVLGSTGALHVKGFLTTRLNGMYTKNNKVTVNQHPTYWDHKGRIFMYYQLPEHRWALCPRSQDGKDFLKDGTHEAIAYEATTPPGSWMEYHKNKWVNVVLALKCASAPQTSPPNIAPLLPAKGRNASSLSAAPATDTNGATATGGDAKRRRTVVARRDEQTVRVWSDEKDDDVLETTFKRVLEGQPSAQELMLFREGDTVQVAVRFCDLQPLHAASATSSSLFPGCHADSMRAVDDSEYAKLFARCDSRVREVKGEGFAVPDAKAEAAIAEKARLEKLAEERAAAAKAAAEKAAAEKAKIEKAVAEKAAAEKAAAEKVAAEKAAAEKAAAEKVAAEKAKIEKVVAEKAAAEKAKAENAAVEKTIASKKAKAKSTAAGNAAANKKKKQ